jgi:3-phosphoshikimate 1-carboxyvinyltransferase
MTELIHPYKMDGVLQAVASKSYLQRALAIASLANGPTLIKNFTPSADAGAAVKIITHLGATVKGCGKIHVIPGKTDLKKDILLDADESGLSLRIFAFVAALAQRAVKLTGKSSLLSRPVEPLVESLLQSGVQVKTTNGTLPLVICGPISKSKIELDGSFSSHMLTGLLIAAPLLEHDTEIAVRKLVSRPYIAMTLNIMREFGIIVENNNFRQFYVKGRQQYKGQEYTVEGDWSSAANYMVAAAVSGKIEMTGLNQNSLQADLKIRDVLVDFGAQVKVLNNFISVSQKNKNAFSVDLTDCPDLFPPLVVLAAAANGTSILTGTDRLIHKESNRLKSILDMFGKMGLKMENKGNELIVHGTGQLTGAEVDSFNDHRMAMSAAVAATLCNSPVTISNAEAVSKSTPDFFKDLNKVMAK